MLIETAGYRSGGMYYVMENSERGTTAYNRTGRAHSDLERAILAAQRHTQRTGRRTCVERRGGFTVWTN